jgi:hypothetical protein
MYKPEEIYQGTSTDWNNQSMKWETRNVISISHSHKMTWVAEERKDLLLFQITEYATLDEAIKYRNKMLHEDSLCGVVVSAIRGEDEDAFVEYYFEDDYEINYCSVEEFIAKYGKKALYGFNVDIVECEEGTLYIC